MDYTVHKQTYSELKERYGIGEKTIRKYFDELNSSSSLKSKTLVQSEIKFKPSINLIMDTTFFGDDRKGLIQELEKRYKSIPVQLCQFHFVKNILKYTGRPKFNSKLKTSSKLKIQDKPKLELMHLVLKLKKSNQLQFQAELATYLENNLKFIQQRTKDNHKYLHRGIRTALSNVKRNLKYIFAYNRNTELGIPKTTNSDEGSFGNWKYKIRLHRHLSQTRKRQMIDEILGQSTSQNTQINTLEMKEKD